MVGKCMPNSGHGGPPGTRVMNIFGIYVNPQISNIEQQNPRRYLIFFLIKFPVEWRQIHVWAPIFDPSYDHFYKCDHFGNKCEGREKGKGQREGKKGREKGKGKREGKKGREKDDLFRGCGPLLIGQFCLEGV